MHRRRKSEGELFGDLLDGKNKRKSKRITFAKALYTAFLRAYPIDGSRDFVEKSAYHSRTVFKRYQSQVDVHVLGFLGLPNQMRDNETVNRETIIRNLFGLQESDTRNYRNFSAWLIAPWNILTIPFKFALNLVKVFTELLPDAMAIYLGERRKELLQINKHDHIHPTWTDVQLGLITAAWAISSLWYFIGRALTSPIKGIRMAYKEGKQANGSVLGMVAAILSGILSIAAIVLIPQLGMQALGAHVASIPGLPAAVSAFFHGLGNIFAPLFSALRITLSPVIAGMSLTIGIGMATFGDWISKKMQRFKSTWYKPDPVDRSLPDPIIIYPASTKMPLRQRHEFHETWVRLHQKGGFDVSELRERCAKRSKDVPLETYAKKNKEAARNAYAYIEAVAQYTAKQQTQLANADSVTSTVIASAAKQSRP